MRYDSSMHTDLTDEELVELVQTGSETAFAQLAARHSFQIWQLVTSNSRQTRDAEEIFQDVWIAVWENIGSLREVKSFGAWLRKIAYTTCRRYYTTTSRPEDEVLQSMEALAETIDRDALARFREREFREAVTEAVHHLPERVRSVGMLYYLEMWTIREIAEELNLAIGTIKTKLRDIRALLRTEFGVEGVERRRTMLLKKEAATPSREKIKVFGVGDAGGNVVKGMIETSLKGVEFYALNTDLEALRTCDGATLVQIGADTTHGIGAGGDPQVGNSAAVESLEILNAVVSDTRLLFVTAGMGGGTGTGAAPLIASLAREHGTLTIGVMTLPFDFEGRHCTERAERGLQELKENADAVIVVPNQRLLDRVDAELSADEAFRMSDEVVRRGVETITEIVVDSGEVNINLSDMRRILQNAGTVLMGVGQAQGENRAQAAMENAISSPLLDAEKIGRATGLIVKISVPPDFTMRELDTAMEILKPKAVDVQIIFGLVYKDNPEPEDTVTVTILAAGIETQAGQTSSPPTQQRHPSSESRTDVSAAASHSVRNGTILPNSVPL